MEPYPLSIDSPMTFLPHIGPKLCQKVNFWAQPKDDEMCGGVLFFFLFLIFDRTFEASRYNHPPQREPVLSNPDCNLNLGVSKSWSLCWWHKTKRPRIHEPHP